MFSLEQAVMVWRRQMLADGIESPKPLDELECHLREEIEHQVQSGVTMEQAFEVAVQRIGLASALKTEFSKLGGAIERKQMRRIITILGGLFGILFGFAMVWPQLGMLHRTGVIPHLQALLVGMAIVVAAGFMTFYNIRKHTESRGRRLVAICLVAVGGLCSAVNASTLFELYPTERLWWPPVVGVIILFFGNCLYFNRTLPMRPAPKA
jgi:hypothetical protein